MYLSNMLSGNISRANYLRKIINEDIKKISLGGEDKEEFIFLGMGLSFADKILNQLLDPKNNLLIVSVKNISEDDIHNLIVIFIIHFIFRLKSEYASTINVNLIIERLENDLNFSKEDSYLVIESEINWNKKANKKNFIGSEHLPMIEPVVSFGKIDCNQEIERKIINIFVGSYNQIKNEFSSLFKEQY